MCVPAQPRQPAAQARWVPASPRDWFLPLFLVLAWGAPLPLFHLDASGAGWTACVYVCICARRSACMCVHAFRVCVPRVCARACGRAVLLGLHVCMCGLELRVRNTSCLRTSFAGTRSHELNPAAAPPRYGLAYAPCAMTTT